MYNERASLYSAIERFTKSKVITYVTSDQKNSEIQIASDVLDHFAEHLDQIGKVNKISLIIYSRGGDTLAGWSLVNLIRQFCNEFQVIIPSKAHSTATLIALGADSIMMTKQATLGPIDPSVNGPLNPQAPGPNPMARIPVSVESINGYMEFVKSVGITNQDKLADLVKDLASRVHPIVLGGVYRTRSQIKMLGDRLLANHIADKAKIKKILDFLCSESGSHDYTIYRDEAKNELGLNIATPDTRQYNILKALHDDYAEELQLMIPFDPNVILGADQEKDYRLVRGLIESVKGGSAKFISEGALRVTQVNNGGVMQRGIQDERQFEGWRND